MPAQPPPAAVDLHAWQDMSVMPVHARVHVRDAAGVVALSVCKKVGTRIVILEGSLTGPAVSWCWPRD